MALHDQVATRVSRVMGEWAESNPLLRLLAEYFLRAVAFVVDVLLQPVLMSQTTQWNIQKLVWWMYGKRIVAELADYVAAGVVVVVGCICVALVVFRCRRRT